MARVSKDKQKETLDKMKDKRVQDSYFLRDLLQKKLDWAKKEAQQGKEAIKSYEEKISQLEKQVLRLEGSIIMLSEIVNAQAKEEDQDDSSKN